MTPVDTIRSQGAMNHVTSTYDLGQYAQHEHSYDGPQRPFPEITVHQDHTAHQSAGYRFRIPNLQIIIQRRDHARKPLFATL